jgi:hypothetical protein
MAAEKSFGLKQLNGFQEFPNHQNKIWNILVLASDLPGQQFPV